MSTKYKAINTVGGMQKRAEKLGIDASVLRSNSLTGNGSFAASGITVDGLEIANRNNPSSGYPQSGGGSPIQGLRCPDCGAQGFTTDHPEVAACGATWGWFFFYKKVEQKQKKKKVIKILNGKRQEVEEVEVRGGETR